MWSHEEDAVLVAETIKLALATVARGKAAAPAKAAKLAKAVKRAKTPATEAAAQAKVAEHAKATLAIANEPTTWQGQVNKDQSSEKAVITTLKLKYDFRYPILIQKYPDMCEGIKDKNLKMRKHKLTQEGREKQWKTGVMQEVLRIMQSHGG